MANSPQSILNAGAMLRRAALILCVSAIGVLVLYTAARALLAAFYNQDFPESLAVKVELLPWLFPVHMITGGLALVLLPAAIALRRRRWHKTVGRIAAADVLVAGLTAYPVAWAAPVTTVSALGFSAQATVWLTLLGLGIYFIRRRQVASHRACMLLMTATASGAVFFRIYLAFWAMLGSQRWFETFYACDAWIAWAGPLAGAALFLRYERRSNIMRVGSLT
jgi:uncharacterized membrane protein YozB (DUF420 family)